jgi:hypothetical protein
MTQRMFSLMALALFVLLGVGCCPVSRMTISVELDPSFQAKYPNSTFDVDLVAVGPNEAVRWEGSAMSMTKYWEAGNGMRRSLATKTLAFNSTKPEAQVVASDDPIWDKWLEGASTSAPPHIYVLVQYPGIHDAARDDKPGNQDFRRQILPTKKCQYGGGLFSGSPTVKLVVNADRVMTVTTISPD